MVWDNTKSLEDILKEIDRHVESITFMSGARTQGQNSYLRSKLGSRMPAYRGVCYLVFHDVPLELRHAGSRDLHGDLLRHHAGDHLAQRRDDGPAG